MQRARAAAAAVFRFDPPLAVSGILHKRWKRFLGAVEIDVAAEVSDVPDVGAEEQEQEQEQEQADSDIPANTTVVHVPNTGPMPYLLAGTPRVMLSVSDNPTRKYAHTLEFIENNGVWVGVHSALANKIAAAFVEQQAVPEFHDWQLHRREVSIGDSRIDLWLRSNGEEKNGNDSNGSGSAPPTKKARATASTSTTAAAAEPDEEQGDADATGAETACASTKREGARSGNSKKKRHPKRKARGAMPTFSHSDLLVEVKSVTMAVDEGSLRVAQWPDTVSERGQRHLRSLMDLVRRRGAQACALFIVQRSDCEAFSASVECDPEYARLLVEARDCGVQILALLCDVQPDGIIFLRKLPVRFPVPS